MEPVVILGAGGHAKVVIELMRGEGRYDIIGCTDSAADSAAVLGVAVMGSDDILTDLRHRGIRHAFVALGDNALRLQAAAKVVGLGFELVNAISPRATVSPTVFLGRGIAIMAGAVINAEATICDLVIINTGASVDHDCRIGEAAHLAPGTVLAGGVEVGRLAFLGTGATVIPRVRIGEAAVIGAGATVIGNIAPRTVAVGVPARPLVRKSTDIGGD
jgi:UDP-perosamine 4-acetyltransferase